MTPPGDADELAFPDDAIEVGRVLGAWGIKGGIRVQPFSKDPEALLSAKRWFIRPPEGLGAKLGVLSFPPSLRVTHSKVHGDSVVATAQQLPDRNAAEAMQGARIFISRSNFPSAGDGEFYWIDLIGLSVRNREGLELGTVSELMSTGPQTVLVLTQPNPDDAAKPLERMIPFVSAYVDKVDMTARLILVDWQADY